MNHRKWRLTLPILALTGVLAFGAACGDDDDDDATQAPGTTTTATTDAGDAPSATTENGTTPEPTPGEAGDTLIQVEEVGDLGEVLVTGDGMTLYIFTTDEPGTSNCTGACATNWPPLTITDPEPPEVEGAEGEFTLIERPDGAMQVAYEGQPLYTYAGDTAAGQTNGQGVGGVWFVAEANPE
jgi:predicted lipoprotein with Yx(FWY)xxD motif